MNSKQLLLEIFCHCPVVCQNLDEMNRVVTTSQPSSVFDVHVPDNIEVTNVQIPTPEGIPEVILITSNGTVIKIVSLL